MHVPPRILFLACYFKKKLLEGVQKGPKHVAIENNLMYNVLKVVFAPTVGIDIV